MSILNRRAVKTGIKNGDGFTKFQEKYGLDEKGLKKQIHYFYNNNQDTAEELIKKIARNEKKYQKISKKPVTEYKGVPIEEFMDMSMDEFMKIENGTAAESYGQKDEPKIPEEVILADEIRKLEDETIKYESQHKRWLVRHHASVKQLGELEEELAKLKDKLVSLKNKYNCIAERDNKIITKANEILEKKHEVEAALEEKRQKLERFSRIDVGVCADGTVTLLAPEATDVKLDDTGWEVNFTNLSNPHRTECQELKMREISAVSKILAVVENDNGAHKFEIAFDSEEMESAYDKFVSLREAT